MKNLSLLLMIFFLFKGCTAQEDYDSDLMYPNKDKNNGVTYGYRYTKLGLLICYPWEYTHTIINKKVNSDTNKKSIVFEFEKNGSLRYWFKEDYIKSPVDTITLADGNISLSKTISRSDNLQIKKIHNGNWKYNFTDSTIEIQFQDNKYNIQPIIGKIIYLDAQSLKILINSRPTQMKKMKILGENIEIIENFTH